MQRRHTVTRDALAQRFISSWAKREHEPVQINTQTFPSEGTVHFIATQFHASAQHRTIIRLSNKNFSKKANPHTKYTFP
jgi:hypothetical protein